MYKFLIVDDQEDIQLLLQEALSHKGYESVLASNGVDALKLLEQNSIDCIVTDIIMPKSTGIQLIKEVKKISPNLPIIAISAGGRNSAEGYLTAAKSLGVDAVLEKPVDLNEFLNTCVRLLRNK